jgi:hypothetical protein
MGMMESLVFYCSTFKITPHEAANDQGYDTVPLEGREENQKGRHCEKNSGSGVFHPAHSQCHPEDCT